MGDIPSKADFVDAADDYRQLANHMRRKGCPTAAEENDLIALACTIAGNVVDEKGPLVETLTKWTGPAGADALANAIREALTKGGGDG